MSGRLVEKCKLCRRFQFEFQIIQKTNNLHFERSLSLHFPGITGKGELTNWQNDCEIFSKRHNNLLKFLTEALIFGEGDVASVVRVERLELALTSFERFPSWNFQLEAQ